MIGLVVRCNFNLNVMNMFTIPLHFIDYLPTLLIKLTDIRSTFTQVQFI